MHDKPFYRTRFAVLKPNGYGMLRAKLVADHVGRTSLDMEPTEGMHVSSHTPPRSKCKLRPNTNLTKLELAARNSDMKAWCDLRRSPRTEQGQMRAESSGYAVPLGR